MTHDFVCEVPAHFQADSPESLQHLAVILGHGRMSNRCTSRLPKILDCLRSNPNLEVSQLIQAGCTPNQAALVYASLAFGRLMNCKPYRISERIGNSRDVFNRYRARYLNCNVENFVCLSLNSKNAIIQERLVATGCLSYSVVHPREVFAPLVREHAAAAIVMHNHPSGDPAPSKEDRDCTSRLVRAGRILGINLLDHVVIGHEDYYSFSDAIGAPLHQAFKEGGEASL
jgi:DNA repair protein RadC